MRKRVKWGPGNPLYDWQRGKKSKSKASRASRGGNVARRKKGGFRRGGVSKPKGALLALGGVLIAGLAGYGAAELARNTVGARGLIKHGAGLAVGGLPGAAGSVVGDVLAGRGMDFSFSMPSMGGTAAPASGATF